MSVGGTGQYCKVTCKAERCHLEFTCRILLQEPASQLSSRIIGTQNRIRILPRVCLGVIWLMENTASRNSRFDHKKTNSISESMFLRWASTTGCFSTSAPQAMHVVLVDHVPADIYILTNTSLLGTLYICF